MTPARQPRPSLTRRCTGRRVIPSKSLGIEDRPLTVTTGSGNPAAPHRQQFHGSGAVSFSTKGEYGVRLMVQLGRHYGRGPASLAEIAAAEDLPRAYLEQLVMSLRDAGLVTSTRGARGGYELTRSPELTPMSDVLRALEGPIAPMVCATDDPEHGILCDRTASCTVNLLWVRIRDAISGALASMTLADLVPLRIPPTSIQLSPASSAVEPSIAAEPAGAMTAS